MRIAVCSDLHLEFGPIDLQNKENAEVLILGGDILLSQYLHDFPEGCAVLSTTKEKIEETAEYRQFLRECSERFKHVIYIAGNHEFYYGDFFNGLNILREECKKYPNIYFLENEVKIIDDFAFIGCTLWTDMNREDADSMRYIKSLLNDYNYISAGTEFTYTNYDASYKRTLTPDDVVNRHNESLKFIKQSIDQYSNDKKIVVVGHHAPCKKSTHPRYIKDVIVNGAYSSDLSEFILDNPQIKMWTHGHTHHRFDYQIGETRIVCNPRGYVYYEKLSDDFELKYVEV